ncbi:hypothetical protein I3843_11G007300 [Carya illinoinensis]|nr:hypothetical protein I3843_11G007300 [Carya illinoinensis]
MLKKKHIGLCIRIWIRISGNNRIRIRLFKTGRISARINPVKTRAGIGFDTGYPDFNRIRIFFAFFLNYIFNTF